MKFLDNSYLVSITYVRVSLRLYQTDLHVTVARARPHQKLKMDIGARSAPEIFQDIDHLTESDQMQSNDIVFTAVGILTRSFGVGIEQ